MQAPAAPQDRQAGVHKLMAWQTAVHEPDRLTLPGLATQQRLQPPQRRHSARLTLVRPQADR